MKSVQLFLVLFAIIFVGGCSSGLKREELKKQIAITQPAYDNKQIQEAYNKKPNLPKSYRLAIYFKPPHHDVRGEDWRWEAKSRSFLDADLNQLKKRGRISDYFLLLNSVVPDDDLKSLRLAAAKHGADALLIIDGAEQLDRYVNGWGATYFLLLPALFVPGSEVDALFVSNASIWDVKNEYLYMTGEAEATANHRYIAAFGKRNVELIDEVKDKSLSALKDQIVEALK